MASVLACAWFCARDYRGLPALLHDLWYRLSSMRIGPPRRLDWLCAAGAPLYSSRPGNLRTSPDANPGFFTLVSRQAKAEQ
jgi:hypothetical protein